MPCLGKATRSFRIAIKKDSMARMRDGDTGSTDENLWMEIEEVNNKEGRWGQDMIWL